jgi:hypothetical protein
MGGDNDPGFRGASPWAILVFSLMGEWTFTGLVLNRGDFDA